MCIVTFTLLIGWGRLLLRLGLLLLLFVVVCFDTVDSGQGGSQSSR